MQSQLQELKDAEYNVETLRKKASKARKTVEHLQRKLQNAEQKAAESEGLVQTATLERDRLESAMVSAASVAKACAQSTRGKESAVGIEAASGVWQALGKLASSAAVSSATGAWPHLVESKKVARVKPKHPKAPPAKRTRIK